MGFRQQEHFHTDMDTPNKEFATQPCAASGTAAGLQHGEQQPALCARGRMRPQHASSATAPPSEADLVSHTVTAPSGCLTASELLTLRKLSRCTPSCDLTCIAQNLFQAPDSAGVRVSAPERGAHQVAARRLGQVGGLRFGDRRGRAGRQGDAWVDSNTSLITTPVSASGETDNQHSHTTQMHP